MSFDNDLYLYYPVTMTSGIVLWLWSALANDETITVQAGSNSHPVRCVCGENNSPLAVLWPLQCRVSLLLSVPYVGLFSRQGNYF